MKRALTHSRTKRGGHIDYKPFSNQTVVKMFAKPCDLKLQDIRRQPTSDGRGGQRFIQDLYDSGYIEFKEETPFRRYYEDEEPDEHDPLYAYLPPDWTGTAETGKEELNKILGNMHGFDTVKPTMLLKRLLEAATTDGDIILDSFGGTGTTAHATLALNARDNLSRHFILVEMLPNVAREITRKRIQKASEGYKTSKGESVTGLGGGFRYVTLGDELFDELGRINETKVRFADLARHVYFSETGEPLPKERVSTKTPLLGVYHGRAVYLLYNGILKDKSFDGGNVLTTTSLKHLPTYDGPKVVYAAGCRFSKARLESENITFKQTPYSIRVS